MKDQTLDLNTTPSKPNNYTSHAQNVKEIDSTNQVANKAANKAAKHEKEFETKEQNIFTK